MWRGFGKKLQVDNLKLWISIADLNVRFGSKAGIGMGVFSLLIERGASPGQSLNIECEILNM